MDIESYKYKHKNNNKPLEVFLRLLLYFRPWCTMNFRTFFVLKDLTGIETCHDEKSKTKHKHELMFSNVMWKVRSENGPL